MPWRSEHHTRVVIRGMSPSQSDESRPECRKALQEARTEASFGVSSPCANLTTSFPRTPSQWYSSHHRPSGAYWLVVLPLVFPRFCLVSRLSPVEYCFTLICPFCWWQLILFSRNCPVLAHDVIAFLEASHTGLVRDRLATVYVFIFAFGIHCMVHCVFIFGFGVLLSVPLGLTEQQFACTVFFVCTDVCQLCSGILSVALPDCYFHCCCRY